MNVIPLRIVAALALSFVAMPFAFAADGSAGKPDSAYYVAPKDLDFALVVKAPPKDDSRETRAELDRMLAIQAKRTPAECELANRDARIDPLRFAEALGLPPSAQALEFRKTRV